MNNADRFATAIFCDDIRNEVGNKISFMGCYQGELLINSVPAVLPKLCVYASAWTPKGSPFKSLVFKLILGDGSELARFPIPEEGLVEAAKLPDETATASRLSINTALVFSPFVVQKPTILRLMLETEEGEINGPRLLLKVSETPTQPQLPN